MTENKTAAHNAPPPATRCESLTSSPRLSIAMLAHVTGEFGNDFSGRADDLIEIETCARHLAIEGSREHLRKLARILDRLSDDVTDRLIRSALQCHSRKGRSDELLQSVSLDRFRNERSKNAQQLQVMLAELPLVSRTRNLHDANRFPAQLEHRKHLVARVRVFDDRRRRAQMHLAERRIMTGAHCGDPLIVRHRNDTSLGAQRVGDHRREFLW